MGIKPCILTMLVTFSLVIADNEFPENSDDYNVYSGNWQIFKKEIMPNISNDHISIISDEEENIELELLQKFSFITQQNGILKAISYGNGYIVINVYDQGKMNNILQLIIEEKPTNVRI